jgi:uncharacterized protein YqfA (UPF0365 family)
VYNLRFLNDEDLQKNIDAWEAVELANADDRIIRDHATEMIDFLQREQRIRAEYDALSKVEVDAFCAVGDACKAEEMDVAEFMMNMGMDPRRVAAFMRYYTTNGRQG